MHKSRILSHLLILGSGRIATLIISTLGTIISTRYLGPTKVGEWAFAGAVIGLLGQVNAMGMETFLVRAIARAPERSSVLVSSALLTRFVLALPVPAVLAVYIYLADLDRETAIIAYLLALSMMLWSFAVVFIWMLQGLEKMSFVAGSDVFLKVIGLAATGLIIVLHGNIIAFAASVPLTTFLLLIITLRNARPYVRLTWRLTRADIREVVGGSLAFWAKDITMTVYSYIDSVILGSLAGARAVGFYSSAGRVFTVGLTAPNIVGNATLPLLSRLGVDTEHDFTRVSRKTLALLILVGVPLTVGLATFAGPVVAALFGPAFRPAVPVLVVLSFCFVPMFLNSQFAQILTARDRQWRWTGIMMVSCVANVLVNLAVIPLAVHSWHNGALGAALAMVATEILSVVYGAVILRHVVLELSMARTLAGALLGGLAQAGIVLLTGSHLWLLVAGEAVGLGAYATIVVAVGAVPKDDVVAVWETARRRVPRVA